MRLLDECCDPRLVAALRAAGHDVQHVLEVDRGAADEVVLALSRAQGRILVTTTRTSDGLRSATARRCGV